MPGYPGAPSVQTVTDKLATIAPELGNVAGIYVYLREHLSKTVYESATPTDSGGNWSIAAVPAGMYQYSYGIHPNTAYEFKSSYLVALNPSTDTLRPYGTASNIHVEPMSVNLQSEGADMSGVALSDAAWTGALAKLPSGGGDIGAPPGIVKISVPWTFPAAGKINLKGCYRAGETGGTKLLWGGAAPVGSSQNLINLPNAGSDQTLAASSIEGLLLSGGWDQVSSPRGTVRLQLRYINFNGPSHAGIASLGGNEEWYCRELDFAGGQYGFYLRGDAAGGTQAYLDKSIFDIVECAGQTVNGIYINVGTSTGANDNQWRDLRLINIAQHGVVLAGGVRRMCFYGVNTENGAGWTALATTAATTGTITSGTSALTVGSTTGMVIDATGATLGSRLTVKGGGANGVDLTANISNIVGSVVTLTATAGTTVAAAHTTFYIYSPFASATGDHGGLPQVTIYDGAFGENYQGGQQYAFDASGFGAGVTFLGNSTSTRAVYDPNQSVTSWCPALPVRRPNNYLTEIFGNSYLGGSFAETPRAQIVSPPGKDLILGLNDSTSNQSGTFGSIQGRRADGNRTRFFHIDSAGHFTPSMGSGTPTTSALNAHVSSATPSGNDQSGKITIVVDATGVAAGQTLFTVNYATALAIQWGQITITDVSTDTSLATVRFHAASLTGSTFQVVCDQALTLSKTYIINYMGL